MPSSWAWNKPRNINTQKIMLEKRAQNWVFRISRSLRYISDFFVLKLVTDGNFPVHSFSSFFSFFVLPRPTTFSVISEVSLLPCWQMFLIDIWGIIYVVSMAVAHGEQHMNKFYLFEFHVNLNSNLGVRSKRGISLISLWGAEMSFNLNPAVV